MKMKIILGLLLSAAAVFAAQTVVSLPENREALNITIYNNNRALVQEIRQIALPNGVSNVRFEGVAQNIIPQSLIVSGGGFRLLEQNYEFDLISREKLLEKFVGKEVVLIDDDGVLGGKAAGRVNAKLIANSFQPIFDMNGQILLGFDGRILLPELPENLYARPTLMWLVQAQRAANVKADVSYLTEGLSWNADYVMLLADNEKNASITSWITLTNQSGAAFENANLRLIAGSVNMVPLRPAPIREARGMVFAQEQMVGSSNDGVEHRSFDEFHLYSVGRAVSIRENQTKQIEMFSVPQINVQRRYRVQSSEWSIREGLQSTDKGNPYGVESQILFQTGQRNNLNMPFPKGVIRIYRKDGDKNVFVGEDHINHTPVNEEITLTTGKAFDITCFVRRVSQRQINEKRFEYTNEVTISNHKKENITVLFDEMTSNNWTIKSDTAHKKINATTARFEINVAAGKTTTLTFTVTRQNQ